jgi:hypothetical protein
MGKKEEKDSLFLEDPEPARAGWAILKIFRSGPIGWAGHRGHCSFETHMMTPFVPTAWGHLVIPCSVCSQSDDSNAPEDSNSLPYRIFNLAMLCSKLVNINMIFCNWLL